MGGIISNKLKISAIASELNAAALSVVAEATLIASAGRTLSADSLSDQHLTHCLCNVIDQLRGTADDLRKVRLNGRVQSHERAANDQP